MKKSVRQCLDRFAVATIFAGVGLLASPRPTSAEVVYTPTSITIGPNASYNLDVNNDGVTDFTITTKYSDFKCGMGEKGAHSYHLSVFETPATGNGAEGKGNRPANLIIGDQIGPSQKFSKVKGIMAYWDVYCPPQTGSSGGNWLNSSGYLGLSFQIEGQTYYGWAYLTVGEDTATLTGYACESTPGMPINAGQTE